MGPSDPMVASDPIWVVASDPPASRETERTWLKMGIKIHGRTWGYEKTHLYEYIYIDGLGLEKVTPK